MAKTRMNNGHRDILTAFARERIAKNVDRKQEIKLYNKLLDETNKQIRKKYPESEMEILRKYELTRTDFCIKYSFPSGRVDGVYFNSSSGTPVDLPYNKGCRASEVFMATEQFEKILAEYIKIKEENDKIAAQKKTDCNSLIGYAKYIEDVLEVIKVPKELQNQLLAKSTSLVALSPDTIKRIQADFN